MGVQKYKSETKVVSSDINTVYGILSNLEFLNFMFNEENVNRIKSQMGDKAANFSIDDFSADRDSCEIVVPKIGTIALLIDDREEPKSVRMKSIKGPVDFTIWIQLIPNGDDKCYMRLTLHAELNMMMKMMVGKKLEEGINKVADGLSNLPFNMMPR